MVFSPFVFKPFTVLIKEITPGLVKTNPFGRSTQDLFGIPPLDRHSIQFRHSTCRKQCTGCRILNGSGKKHILPIRCKGGGNFRSRMISQSPGSTSIGRHNKKVKIPIAVAGKSNLLSIGRPDRIGFIRGLCC